MKEEPGSTWLNKREMYKVYTTERRVLRACKRHLYTTNSDLISRTRLAIKCVRWFQTGGQDYVATGSWDKTVKFWNLQGAEPVGTLTCQERVYSMDVKDQLLVIATAERHIHMVNLSNPTTIYKTITSPLKWQTRVVSCFSDATGFAVGSIEGRCAIQYVEDKDTR